jgi:hypothetical protein
MAGNLKGFRSESVYEPEMRVAKMVTHMWKLLSLGGIRRLSSARTCPETPRLCFSTVRSGRGNELANEITAVEIIAAISLANFSYRPYIFQKGEADV